MQGDNLYTKYEKTMQLYIAKFWTLNKMGYVGSVVKHHWDPKLSAVIDSCVKKATV